MDVPDVVEARACAACKGIWFSALFSGSEACPYCHVIASGRPNRVKLDIER